MTDDIRNHLIDIIVANSKHGQPFVLAINGIDGSGKTFLCDQLEDQLNQKSYDVCRLSVDNFHNPKSIRYQHENQAEAYFLDSINFELFKQKALIPIYESSGFPKKIQVKGHNLETDQEEIVFQEISKNTVILAEGVFLFKADLLPYYDLKIFLDVAFDTIIERVKVRDLKTLKTEDAIVKRYLEKYIPGQQLYFDEAGPLEIADIVIDNNDYSSPSIIKKRS